MPWTAARAVWVDAVEREGIKSARDGARWLEGVGWRVPLQDGAIGGGGNARPPWAERDATGKRAADDLVGRRLIGPSLRRVPTMETESRGRTSDGRDMARDGGRSRLEARVSGRHEKSSQAAATRLATRIAGDGRGGARAIVIQADDSRSDNSDTRQEGKSQHERASRRSCQPCETPGRDPSANRATGTDLKVACGPRLFRGKRTEPATACWESVRGPPDRPRGVSQAIRPGYYGANRVCRGRLGGRCAWLPDVKRSAKRHQEKYA